MKNKTGISITERILTIRDRKVILDSDLARIYGVEVKRLNEQVKRNRNRFPTDFMFQLTAREVTDLRSQIAAASPETPDNQGVVSNWSQIATSSAPSRSQNATLDPDGGMRSHFATASSKHRGVSYRPYAFTEHGAIMAATVLNSPQAVEMSVFVVRAFVKMREQLLATATLAKRLAEVEKNLLIHDEALRDLYRKIRPLLLPPPEPERKPIGFGVKERRAKYRTAKIN